MNEAYLSTNVSEKLFISPQDTDISIFLHESTSLFIASLGHGSTFSLREICAGSARLNQKGRDA